MKLNSNKKIHLLVDTVKMAMIVTIACAMVSLIVFAVSEDPVNAIYHFFVGPLTSPSSWCPRSLAHSRHTIK